MFTDTIIFTHQQYKQLFAVLALIKYQKLTLKQNENDFIALFDNIFAFKWNNKEEIWELQ